MNGFRDILKKKIVDQEELELKCEYVDVDDVTEILNDIERRINTLIVEMEDWNFSYVKEKLEDLSRMLY